MSESWLSDFTSFLSDLIPERETVSNWFSSSTSPSTGVASSDETKQTGGGSWYGDLINTGLEGAIGLGTSLFGLEAAEDSKDKDRAYAEQQAEKERQRELDLLALKAKYGLLGGGGGGASQAMKQRAQEAYAKGHQDVIQNRIAVGERKAASLRDLAELTQRAALRSGR